SRRRHTRFSRDWSSDVCSSDLHQQCRAAVTQLQRTLRVAGRPGLEDIAQRLLDALGKLCGQQPAAGAPAAVAELVVELESALTEIGRASCRERDDGERYALAWN